MDWLATLRRSGGLHALSRKLEMSPADVIDAGEKLLPRLLNIVCQFVESHGGDEAGVKALVELLAKMGDGDLAAEVMGPGPLNIAPGEKLLDTLAPDWLTSSPEATPLASQLQPGLAMLVGGYIAARAAGSGGDAGQVERVAEMLELDWPRRRDGAVRWHRGS